MLVRKQKTLICGSHFAKLLRTFVRKRILIEVERVKAHRMPLFEKFLTEGHEKTDELATGGAMLDGVFLAQARASPVQ